MFLPGENHSVEQSKSVIIIIIIYCSYSSYCYYQKIYLLGSYLYDFQISIYACNASRVLLPLLPILDDRYSSHKMCYNFLSRSDGFTLACL